jgi:Flp pilus assembly pilin Flp
MLDKKDVLPPERPGVCDMGILQRLPSKLDRKGTVSVEYALLAVLVASAVAAGSAGLSTGFENGFGRMAAAASGPSVAVRSLP